ncbi:PTS sugar transporter subunit IIA [Fusobacterium sp.]|uniref:PTS sugar transporter subunit IIA n=1 Tax=Fusobacterium sp. TaxID=68766 RepID=UPI0026127F31|nr:PTS sugar transporter subunit IIA [Fusobacterium sp.]
MKFSNYLDSKLIFTDVKGTSMEEVIKEMIEKIASKEKNVNLRKEEITACVIKREEEISTAIGNGVAIPHARIENFNDFIVAVGVVEVPFKAKVGGSASKDAVELVFLIISDILKNKNILKIMSAVSKLVIKYPHIADKIKTLKNTEEILKAVQEADIEIGHKITAEDVLSPNVAPVYPESTLEEVAKRLIIEHASGFPVVDKDGKFLGEITEKELIEFGMPKYLSLMKDLNFLTVGEPFEEYLVNEKTTTIEKIYRPKNDLIILDKKAPIMEICFIMVNKGVTRLYIVENGKYLGIIKRSDIIKKVLHI